MATGVLTGLNPARMVGSGPNNGGLTDYKITSGYATGLGKGAAVKLSATGTLNKATNDTDDAIGVFLGVNYTDSLGEPKFSKQWIASTVATDIVALVNDSPFATFTAKGDAAITSVNVGDIYALNLTAPDTITGRSTSTVDVSATVAAALGLVKVIKVLDVDTRALEVVLVDHALRDDG